MIVHVENWLQRCYKEPQIREQIIVNRLEYHPSYDYPKSARCCWPPNDCIEWTSKNDMYMYQIEIASSFRFWSLYLQIRSAQKTVLIQGLCS